MRNYESIEFLLKELEYIDGKFYRNGRLVKPYKGGKGGYARVEVRKDGKRYRAFVHNLVFAKHHGIEELKKHETVDHINANKDDNEIENLQGLTLLANSKKDSGGKLSLLDAKMIKVLIENDIPLATIARRFEVSSTTISKIKNGLRFKYI
jgi:hypothetical protein